MRIENASPDQPSVYSYYKEIADTAAELGEFMGFAKGGRQMLSFLHTLEHLADEVPLRAVLVGSPLKFERESLELVPLELVPGDITVSWDRGGFPSSQSGFCVAHRLGVDKAPWPGAEIRAFARDAQTACAVVRRALILSGTYPSLQATPIPAEGTYGFENNEGCLKFFKLMAPVRLGESAQLSDLYLDERLLIGVENCKQMRELAKRLDVLARGVPLWGTASSEHGVPLILSPSEQWRGCHVMVWGPNRVSYRIVDSDAPWPCASVASIGGMDVEEAFRRICIGMRRCGGWPDPGAPLSG